MGQQTYEAGHLLPSDKGHFVHLQKKWRQPLIFSLKYIALQSSAETVMCFLVVDMLMKTYRTDWKPQHIHLPYNKYTCEAGISDIYSFLPRCIECSCILFCLVNLL